MENNGTTEFDVEDFNDRMLAKIGNSQLTRYEGTSLKCEVVLHSPEVKRIYARRFSSFQGNLYIMLEKARYQFPREVLDQVLQVIQQRIAKCTALVEQEITTVQKLLGDQGVACPIAYADAPLTVVARVISGQGRRYLELLQKADQMMVMLDTLAAVDPTTGKLCDIRKKHFKRRIQQIAGTVQEWQAELKRVRSAQDHARWPSGLRRTADAACLMPIKEGS